MSRLFTVSTTIASNCLFTLAISVFISGQFQDTEIAIGAATMKLHIDIDASGVSFTRRDSGGSMFSITSHASDANHWQNLFTSNTRRSWQNLAFAYDDGIKSMLIGSGKRVTTIGPERYGVRHWCLCLLSSGLFGLVHRRYLLMLWQMFGRFSRRSPDKRGHGASSRAA